MNLLRAISRLILGLTFIFSGFVKIIDPVGSGLIVGEYFKIIGIGSLPLLYQIVGVALSGTELLLGISILLGLRMKLSGKAALIFISVFTVITLFLALFNPIQECGCFGEALKLTNWQTLYKNSVLLIFALVLFFQRDKFIPIAPQKWEWGFVGVYALLIVLFSIYSFRHLPIIDFMEYKVGTNIAEKMSNTANNDDELFETTLVYKKDGKLKEFTINELPDSSWIFIDSKTRKISSKALPVALNFSISDREGNYITDSILSLKGKLFITSIPYFNKLSEKQRRRIITMNDELAKREINHIILSGSSFLMIDSLGSDFQRYTILNSDFKTLITMNRSNGGLIYISDGIISSKWSINDLPISSIDRLLDEDSELLAAKSRIMEQLAAELTALIILVLIAVMRYICRIVYTHKTTPNENYSESESKES